MANRPCFGAINCPHCGATNPVFWNGNTKWKCINCQKEFKVHRQKLKNVEYYKGNTDVGDYYGSEEDSDN